MPPFRPRRGGRRIRPVRQIQGLWVSGLKLPGGLEIGSRVLHTSGSMRNFFFFIGSWWAGALVAILAADARAEELGMARPQAGHLPPTVLAPLDPPSPPDHPHRYRDYMVYQLPEALRKWASLDKTLTHLCERGAFTQQKPQALYAVAGNTAYGVAFAEGANLHDPQNRAKPGNVYFFGRADTSHCVVFTAPEAALKKFVTATPGSLRPAPVITSR